ncbi:LSU ribosomal protein L35p [uncultured Candidatus Thioglobus sp.]|nr:LSU ribosomal protein L35p [uncultured Candidatus Thioglobus sp.]
MPKIKSNRGAAKRFAKNGSGKFKHRQSFRNHILTSKSTKRKRQLRSMNIIHANDQKIIASLLPYS